VGEGEPDAESQRLGRRIVYGAYLLVAGAFILSSAWQITAAVFGLR
jgi:hypothetical protein